MIEASIPVGSPEQLILLFGTSDQHLRRIRESTEAKISTRGGKIHLSGPENAVLHATAIFEQMRSAITSEGALMPHRVDEIIGNVVGKSHKLNSRPVDVKHAGRTVRPRTPGQEAYVEAIRNHDLVFCIGPAGTGKTYLAVATAIEAFTAQQIR